MARPVAAAVAALAALTALRLLVAAEVPLSPDESYYFIWSRALAAGYLDHPPMVALWIRAGTALAGDSAFGIRLLAPLATALGSILLWQCAERLLPGRQAGWRAAALLNATLLFGIGATTLTPDTPLLFFWVCTLWALARVLTGDHPAWWLAVGLFTGLAMDSKYTAAFLPLGIALWLLLAGRAWLARPWPWLGGLTGLITFAPVLVWNAAHGWASFAKQGGRVERLQLHRAAQYLVELAGGQLGLATPLVLILCMAGLVLATRHALRTREPRWTLLAAVSLPAVVVFVQHAFSDRVQGNWPAIIYPACVIAAAGLTAPHWRRMERPAVLLGLGCTLLVYLQGVLALFPLPVRYDVTALQLAGWPRLASQADAARAAQHADFIAADQYGVASELAYWLPAGVQAVAAGGRWHLFSLARADIAGQTGILVRSTRRGELTAPMPWAKAELIGTTARERDGVPVETYRLYRVTVGAASPELVILPHQAAGTSSRP